LVTYVLGTVSGHHPTQKVAQTKREEYADGLSEIAKKAYRTRQERRDIRPQIGHLGRDSRDTPPLTMHRNLYLGLKQR